MKLRNLSLLLFAAACGGGNDPDPVPIDSPAGDGGGFFPNSRNDVFYVTFTPTEGLTPELTPDTGDAPDNEAAFAIGVNGTGIAGEMGIAGDKSDSYEERDTYLLATDAAVNQLTIRMDWEGGNADLDYLLFAEPAEGDTEFIQFGSGTAISNGVDDEGNPSPEFATFTVDPSRNYLLWGGVFEENADGGGSPSLPKMYDLSIYGESVTTANTPSTCDFTEANDAGNNAITRFGGTGTKENANITATGTKVYCGTLNPTTFVPDPANAMVGTEDVDSFTINVPLEGNYTVTLIGQTEADQTKINTLIEKGALQAGVMNDACTAANCGDVDPNTPGVQKRLEQFFGLATHTGTHGVDAYLSFESGRLGEGASASDAIGPKGVSIFVRSLMADAPVLTETINYKIVVSQDNRDVRAARKTGDKAEANDN